MEPQTAPELALAQMSLSSSGTIVSPLINTSCLAQGFRIEESRASVTALYPEILPHTAVEPNVLYYKNNFVGKEHINFCGEDPDGPVVVSILLPQLNSEKEDEWCKAIVRTKKDDHRLMLPYSSSRKEMQKAVAKALPALHVSKWIEVKDSAFVESLAKFEQDVLVSKFKLGVLLCNVGQTEENTMFGNGMISGLLLFYNNIQ